MIGPTPATLATLSMRTNDTLRMPPSSGGCTVRSAIGPSGTSGISAPLDARGNDIRLSLPLKWCRSYGCSTRLADVLRGRGNAPRDHLKPFPSWIVVDHRRSRRSPAGRDRCRYQVYLWQVPVASRRYLSAPYADRG